MRLLKIKRPKQCSVYLTLAKKRQWTSSDQEHLIQLHAFYVITEGTARVLCVDPARLLDEFVAEEGDHDVLSPTCAPHCPLLTIADHY